MNDANESTQESTPVVVREDAMHQAKDANQGSVFHTIQRVTAWIMVASAILFALIGILAVWDVFGDNAGDVIWRSLSSLAIISFAALIINVSLKVLEDRK
jgi:hypothetical protein